MVSICAALVTSAARADRNHSDCGDSECRRHWYFVQRRGPLPGPCHLATAAAGWCVSAGVAWLHATRPALVDLLPGAIVASLIALSRKYCSGLSADQFHATQKTLARHSFNRSVRYLAGCCQL